MRRRPAITSFLCAALVLLGVLQPAHAADKLVIEYIPIKVLAEMRP